MQIKEALFEAFRKDHAQMGRALFDLRSKLDAGDFDEARVIAAKIDRETGAHIVFEEEDFYPALRAFLSRREIDEMYKDHADGYDLIRKILRTENNAEISSELQADLVKRVEKMESHVSACGELFGAMGGLTQSQQEHLMERLRYWRRVAPTWTKHISGKLIPGL